MVASPRNHLRAPQYLAFSHAAVTPPQFSNGNTLRTMTLMGRPRGRPRMRRDFQINRLISRGLR